jgi:nicotinate-nucleotide adenylyltransferase
MSPSRATWAVFGGSFDPPHVGHVLAAQWALSTQRIESVVVIPALVHAFGKPLEPFPHRRRMCELAFAGVRGVRVSDLEARMPSPSYTVHTLERLRAEYPHVDLRLMIGSDLVLQLPSWREGERVVALAPPLVIGRGGHLDGDEEIAMPTVSSTEVRRRFRAGESLDALVPWAVRDHVARFGLYRA